MSGTDVQRAMDRALRALGMRAHSEAELVEKLTRAGYDERTIAEVMAKLAQHRYTDDKSFARQWAVARARRGMGAWRIAQELRHKGIEGDIAEEAIAQIDEDDALEQATALALKHLRRGDERARKRAYDALVRRGYGFDLAREALASALEAYEAEDDETDDD